MPIAKTTICRIFGIWKKDYRIEKLEHYTTFRGKFLIHASKNVEKNRMKALGIDYNKLTRGAIIGTAVLHDVKHYNSKAELEKDINKLYADIKKFWFL